MKQLSLTRMLPPEKQPAATPGSFGVLMKLA
jgi:hypothetical protein